MSKIKCARLETKTGNPVMLEGVKASGDLRGLMFEASVEQRFRNPTDKNIEVVYTFPLPWGAVLLGVDVQLGDKYLSCLLYTSDAADDLTRVDLGGSVNSK